LIDILFLTNENSGGLRFIEILLVLESKKVRLELQANAALECSGAKLKLEWN